jgi:hypothetical protein
MKPLRLGLILGATALGAFAQSHSIDWFTIEGSTSGLDSVSASSASHGSRRIWVNRAAGAGVGGWMVGGMGFSWAGQFRQPFSPLHRSRGVMFHRRASPHAVSVGHRRFESRAQPVQPFQVVGRADQRPFQGHFLPPSRPELPKSHHAHEQPQHLFHRLLAQFLGLFADAGREPGAHYFCPGGSGRGSTGSSARRVAAATSMKIIHTVRRGRCSRAVSMRSECSFSGCTSVGPAGWEKSAPRKGNMRGAGGVRAIPDGRKGLTFSTSCS